MTERNDRACLAAIVALSGVFACLAAGTFFAGSTTAFAQAGSTGGSIDDTIGGTIGETDKPVSSPNSEAPGGTAFDGTWASAAVAKTCKGRVSGTFKVSGGRLFTHGVSGHIGPGGAAEGVNHFKGYIVTWTGQFSGDKASGQWRRDDGCIGSWEAVRE